MTNNTEGLNLSPVINFDVYVFKLHLVENKAFDKSLLLGIMTEDKHDKGER